MTDKTIRTIFIKGYPPNPPLRDIKSYKNSGISPEIIYSKSKP